MAPGMDTPERRTLLTLPPEIRNHIFTYLVEGIECARFKCLLHGNAADMHPKQSGLILTEGVVRACRQLRHEVLSIYYRLRAFTFQLDYRPESPLRAIFHRMSGITSGAFEKSTSIVFRCGIKMPAEYCGTTAIIHLTVNNNGGVVAKYRTSGGLEKDRVCICMFERRVRHAEKANAASTFDRLTYFTRLWQGKTWTDSSMKFTGELCKRCGKRGICFAERSPSDEEDTDGGVQLW